MTQAQTQSQSLLSDQARSSESVVGLQIFDDCVIMTQNLGHCSWWQKGVGSLPRMKVVGGPRVASSSDPSAIHREQAKTIASLQR
ncbi:hypothetical protein TorRG33x02_138560, partial [Trema orientale]